MTQNRSYNRIVFLTTLSLYLGLVLVGGTAPVLAHSALNKHFDIRNEIEFKDDLDNKPDGNPNFQDIEFAYPLAKFLIELNELKVNEPSVYQKEKLFFARRERLVYSDDSVEIVPRKFQISPSPFDGGIKKLLDSIDKKSLYNLADFSISNDGKKSLKQFTFEVSPIESGAKITISFEKNSLEKASLLTDQLNLEFHFRAYKAKHSLVKRVYENTYAYFTNNQVFIVTRLPRAAIDEFLAAKNAQ